jgi:hypothetical protein
MYMEFHKETDGLQSVLGDVPMLWVSDQARQ